MRSLANANSVGPAITGRVILEPVRLFWVRLLGSGEPLLSAALDLEAAVLAVDTGALGLELRRGGESLGGGSEM
jgi:hypothetical protein